MTPTKERALQALLTQRTKAEAATAAGISPRTLRVYLQDPEFQRAYNAAFSGLMEEATKQAQRSLSPAISTLREIVEDEDQPATARISAARSLLEYGLRLVEVSDILARLDKLEQSEAGDWGS